MWRIGKISLIFFIEIVFVKEVKLSEPCDTIEFIDDWQRSVAFGLGSIPICDNFLAEGLYRVPSGAGERMPTECPVGGSRCNTVKPIYLYVDDLEVDEDPYPAVGTTVNRTAYAANYDGDCKHKSYDIQIKNCSDYLVYYLESVSGGCSSAYCFGDQLPCPNDTLSETGFTPGCKTFPDVTVTPYVKTSLLQTERINEHGVHMVYSRATFECHADDLQDDYKYTTRWYINGIEMTTAKVEELSKTKIQNGFGRMLEEHWKSTFKPNMLVKCTMQISGDGFETVGPQLYSDNFFAGIKITQSSTSDYVVLEGEELRIPVQLTMPLSCSWPKNVNDDLKNQIKNEVCLLVLLNGIPEYQTTDDQCVNGITNEGVVFNAETCGIKFSYSNWQEGQEIVITGQTDQMVNIKDRIAFLRLYNSDEVTPVEDIIYWKNIHLPDIKVVVKDQDVVTLGTSCYSHNDPHMRTFDGRNWELQISNGLTEGEYIMYKHDRLPLQVSGYFQKCYGTVLCNCGVAVRSGDSVFVANYCSTIYQGGRKVNRYLIQRLCDDQSLIVIKTSTSYTITFPTGTKVTFNYGSNWIDGIHVIPSILDVGLTKGICGTYNGNVNDDFTPRDQLITTTSEQTFADSWQVKGKYADETLFDPDGKLKETEYYGQQYCSCVSPDDNYPHGSPEFNCELTSAMEPCRNTKTTAGVFTAQCITPAVRRKRSTSKSVSQDDEQPPAYPMITEESSPEIITETWKNGWTEESARDHCTKKFESAAAYSVCTEYVPYVNVSSYIAGCIADIKSTGGDSWLKVSLKNYGSACFQESKRLEILSVTNSTNSTGSEKSIRAIIEESTCPDNCSNNGMCVDGECQCTDGYYGEVCSIILSQAPLVIQDAFEGLCDKSKKPCQTFVIPGNDFIDGEGLKCKFTAFSLKKNGTVTVQDVEETFTHPGTYSSSLLMLCKLPASRRKRSADFEVVATGYYISVSNNNLNFTEPLTTIIYDSVCYECNTTSMSCIKQDTCPVQETDAPKETTKKTFVIIAVIAGVVTAVLVVVMVFIGFKKCKTKKPYIRDSTLSLPNTTRQIAPKTHFLNDDQIFLSEKYRSHSNFDEHKSVW